MTTERKIVQITAYGTGENNQTLGVFALCNDATVFLYWEDKEWHKLPPIPQDETKADPAKLSEIMRANAGMIQNYKG